MDSIAKWLQGLGLGQYTATFKANDLDVLAAAKLTDADLRELGVAALGHRKRLLEAIAALAERQPGATALERRFLTVMFCDLADSTALTAELGPEAMVTLIAGYQQCCARAVSRFKGKIARYVGDGVLAYFGHPKSHEDSAERAVRAGLELLRALPEAVPAGMRPLKVRIGIATGPVVVGDLPGGSLVERNAVVGETPNLAARLQQGAAPGSIVVSEATQRLVSAQFECEELPSSSLKGFNAPVRAWRVAAERAFAGRFEARRAAGLTPYVNRVSELAFLEACWRAAQGGAGRIVSIVGEPGIGKSRLVDEMASRCGARAERRLDWFGSPFLEASPLGPVVASLQRAAAFAPDDTAAGQREKLDALLHSSGVDRSLAPILASLLSLPGAPGDPPVDPDPRRRKRLLFDAIAAWIEALARHSPLIFVCEDVHWFDRATRELLERLGAGIASLPLLLVCTSRRSAALDWKSASAAELILEKLERTPASELIERIASGEQSLSDRARERILERSDGSPLYIEELTRAVLASGDVPRDAALPETLRDLLIARLDHAAPVIEVAQVGAAIGREFSQGLLEAVVRASKAEVRRTLDQLAESGVLRRTSSSAGAAHVFRHALLQEAAYETLLLSSRRDIHRRIAETLEDRFRETIENQPELVAQHWERAEAPEPAIRYWLAAGRRAASRSADRDADAHLRRALALIEQLPEGRDRDALELEARIQHGGILRALFGPPAPETGRAFMRARDLCRALGAEQELPAALSGLYAYHFVRAENERALETAEQLLELGASRDDRRCLMIGHRTLGMVMVHTGRLPAAREHLERALSLYDEASDNKLAFLYGTDPAQTAAGFLAKALWLLGFPEAAEAREAWSAAHAAKVNHLFSIVQAAMFRISVRMWAREWDAAAALARETRGLATRHSLRFTLAFTDFCLAAARSVQRPDAEVLAEMRRAADAWGPLNYRPQYLGLIAEAQARLGDFAGGLAQLDEARALVRGTGERWIEPELCRLQGEIRSAAASSAAGDPEPCFREAIAIARDQGARSWELRAQTSLARLLKARGRAAEGRTGLLAAYEAFPRGFGTPDLEDARELLSEL